MTDARILLLKTADERIARLEQRNAALVAALTKARDIAWPSYEGRTIIRLSDDMAKIVELSEAALAANGGVV